jgi:glucosamine--fructose-6-phosphate aminotransferase (isomerizing)
MRGIVGYLGPQDAVGEDETVIASDISAIVGHTRRVIFLRDGDLLTARRGKADITSFHNVPVSRELTHIDGDLGRIEKGGFEHFMLKEIHEQPEALTSATRGGCPIDQPRNLAKSVTVRRGVALPF